jgi:hypothetical protein
MVRVHKTRCGYGWSAERHFIESKSDIDPTNKEGAAKVATFILGAANRDPERAKKYLEGHAVMILGVGEKQRARDLSDSKRKTSSVRFSPMSATPGPDGIFSASASTMIATS